MTGTFTTGDTGGTIETINVPYEGNGWPVFVAVFAEGGLVSVPSDPTAAACVVTFIKRYADSEPTYDGQTTAESNGVYGAYMRKSSNVSGIGGVNAISSTGVLFNQADPAGTYANATRMPDATTIKCYVRDESYGYAAGTVYRYVVAYSE